MGILMVVVVCRGRWRCGGYSGWKLGAAGVKFGGDEDVNIMGERESRGDGCFIIYGFIYIFELALRFRTHGIIFGVVLTNVIMGTDYETVN